MAERISAAKPAENKPVAAAQEKEALNGRAAKKLCDELCNISKPLKCRNGRECPTRCRSMAAMPICKTELSRVLECLVHQPAKNWECDEDGVGAIRDPFCSREQAELTACMERSLQR